MDPVHWEVSPVNDRQPAKSSERRDRAIVIGALAFHLAYLSLQSYGVYLLLAYSLERQASLGVTAVKPILAAALVTTLSVLFISSLISFVRRGTKALLLSSVAGIGGYAANAALVLNDGAEAFWALQFHALLLYFLPMLLLLTFRNLHRERN